MVISPYKLVVSKVGDVNLEEASFTITNVSDEELDLSLVSQPPGYFQLDLPERIGAGEAAECNVSINRRYLADSFEKSLTFEFSDAAKSRFTLPIVRRFIKQKKAASKTQPDKPTAVKTGTAGGH